MITRGDIFGILCIIVLLVGILYIGTFHPGLAEKTNHGFGPEWTCLPVDYGDPVCFKRPIQTNDPATSQNDWHTWLSTQSDQMKLMQKHPEYGGHSRDEVPLSEEQGMGNDLV